MTKDISLEKALQRVRVMKLAETSRNAAKEVFDSAGEFRMDNLSLIPELWEVYQRLGEQRPSLKGKDTYARGRFVYVIVLMYSPETFVGYYLRDGVRGALAEVFGIKSKPTISGQINQVLSDYEHYRGFREDVAFVWDEFMRWLETREDTITER